MATKKVTDSFANIAAISVTESAAGTLTYAKFAFPFSIMDKVALVINRLEYWPEGISYLNSSSDQLNVALIASSTVTSLSNQADPVILDMFRIIRNDIGTAASGELLQFPYMKDLSNLPGGGILCAPSPLSLVVQSTGASNPMGCWLKMFYTYMELSTDEYWQLVESRRIIST